MATKELKIPIVADANSAISGLNDTADSASKLFRQLTKGEATLEQFEKQLGEDLAVAASKAGYGLKGMQAQYKGLMNFMEKSRQKWGNESEIYKDIAASANYAKGEIDKLESSEEGLAQVTDQYATAAKNAAPAVDKFAVATKELDQTSKGYLTRLVTLTKNILTFQLIMGPIRSAISGVKNTLKESMSVAAEAEQIYSKLSTVFDGFEDSARRASIALASSLGVAQSTSSSALSTVGDLLQAQGMGTAESLSTATGWVKQFQDIIAFKDINMSLEEFAQNFMSGAAGNLRNFRTFGSIVKESAVNAELAKKGYDKLTGSQLELAKMTARAELALRQQANAMGATEREWDTMLSVNRRLNEAWKEYKENLGDTINSVLKPMKAAWADVLDQINKAKKAQEEYNKGNKSPGVYDMENSASDRASFTKRLTALLPGGQSPLASVVDIKDMEALQSLYYKQLKEIFIEFEATVEDVSRLMGDTLSDAIYEELKVIERRRNAEIEFLKAQEARKATISSAADTFSALQETLLGIAGVSFNPTSITELIERGKNSDSGMQGAMDRIALLTAEIIGKAADSLDASELAETWGDVISRELGELDEADLLQGRKDSYRKLFEAAWNAYLPGGIDSKEQQALDNIKKSYKEATLALDAYNKKIQIQNALLSANATMASASSSLARLKYENGLTGTQAENDYEMTTVWDIPLQVEAFAKSLRDVGVPLEDVIKSSKRYERILQQEAALKFRASFASERNAVLSPYTSAATDYQTQLANLGLSDAQITRAKYISEMEAALADGDNELATEISKTIMWFDRLQTATEELEQAEAQKALQDKVNPFSGLQSSWQMGEAAGVGGVVGILAEILTQTEAFSELTNLVSDTFLPIFDAVMKPLIPMIKVVQTIFDLLPWEALFEVFKVIASVIVAISFPIKIICAVIKNIYTAVHNILERILHPITGGDQWSYESLKDILDDTEENLEKIADLAFKIERNTENNDLSALWKLYNAKLIDESTFYKGADVLQKNLFPFEALADNRPKIEVNIKTEIVDTQGNVLDSTKETFEENGYEINYPIGGWTGLRTSAAGRYMLGR